MSVNNNRKILQAKRHGQQTQQNRQQTQNNRRFVPDTEYGQSTNNRQQTQRHVVPDSTTLSRGLKRANNSEYFDQPSPKRQYNSSTSRLTSNINQRYQNSPKNSPKNLAERRMQDLRRSLETKREQERLQETPRQRHNNSPYSRPSQKNSTNLKIKSTSSSSANKSENVETENIITTDVQNDLFENYLMDWEPIDENTIVSNIHELRKEINYRNQLPTSIPTKICDSNTTLQNGIHIVVDTNIFLSHLQFLPQLRDTTFPGSNKAIIVAPWMVVQELDYMKNSNCQDFLSRSARRAIQFINEQLASDHPQFIGQTVLEASYQNMSSNNPDDGILFCCLQLALQNKKVVLLSNDINLRNKAIINKVDSYNHHEIISKLKEIKISGPSLEDAKLSITKIKILLSNLLTVIIEHEMQNAYGDIWQKMANLCIPITLEEALSTLDKYWRAVFSMTIQKQCKQIIEDFLMFVRNLKYEDNLKKLDYNKFLEFSLCLCIYLKNAYTTFRDQISTCICNIQKCTEAKETNQNL